MMPKKSMAAFVERLARDERLLAQLRGRVGDRQGDQALLAMLDLAARHGFEILFAEARALRDRIVAEAGSDADSADRALDDDELAGLAAGLAQPSDAGRQPGAARGDLGRDAGQGPGGFPDVLPRGLVDLVRRW